jgi:hypothetical protein
MSLILDNQNVFEYLASLNYCQITDRDQSEVRLISAKNFNLLIKFSDCIIVGNKQTQKKLN